MLIEFSVENYLSFKDRVTLSMVASKDDSLKENVIYNAQNSGFDLLKSVAIYGPNASGKSNLLKAFYFMRDFVLKSTEGQKDSKIGISNFKLDQNCSSKPSVFEVAFLFEGVRYQYGFSVTSNDVIEEWLYSYPKKQQRTLFERDIKEEKFYFGSHWEGEKSVLENSTRSNSLFMTLASQLNNKLAEIITAWFSLSSPLTPKINELDDETFVTELLSMPLSFDFDLTSEKINNLLKMADLGILEVNFKQVPIKDSVFWTQYNKEQQKTLELDDEITLYKIKPSHLGIDENGNESIIPFDLSEESDGTLRLLCLFYYYLWASRFGGLIIIDEIDIKLNSLLINWFIRKIQNISSDKQYQMIFTTHNVELMDSKLFRRDQIWFTEKQSNGATDLFSLWDFKTKRVRKGENIRKGYLAGTYGAIPILEDL